MGGAEKRIGIGAIFRMRAFQNVAKSPHPGASPTTPGSLANSLTLGVFAKHWTPGATKTRLAADLGDQAAAAASRLFLEATIDRLSDEQLDNSQRLVAYTPSHQAASFAKLAAVESRTWRIEPQAPGTLGERMHQFFEQSLARTDAAIVVGTDSPNMPLAAVSEAITWLTETPSGPRLVLGPTDDGGYWLIGIRGQMPPIFDQMPWSEANLMKVTLDRLAAAGWSEGEQYRLVTPWYDVDEAADLVRLRSGLRGEDLILNRLADQLDELLGPATAS